MAGPIDSCIIQLCFAFLAGLPYSCLSVRLSGRQTALSFGLGILLRGRPTEEDFSFVDTAVHL